MSNVKMKTKFHSYMYTAIKCKYNLLIKKKNLNQINLLWTNTTDLYPQRFQSSFFGLKSSVFNNCFWPPIFPKQCPVFLLFTSDKKKCYHYLDKFLRKYSLSFLFYTLYFFSLLATGKESSYETVSSLIQMQAQL